MKNEFSFDVVVIGGGHAGCEAAAASARLRRAEACLLYTSPSPRDSLSSRRQRQMCIRDRI